ncbi:MAG TPA: response regulator [Thermoanaerobaculia bacterium]|nr:response regulator [Thermoanaerobaculia bacterium]
MQGEPVLVADDDPLNRKLLTMILKDEGHEVTTVEDGVEAIDIIKRKEFKAIVLDLLMPEVSGFEVVQHLIAHNPMILERVIILTGLDEKYTGRFDHSMFYAFATKPIDRVTIAALVSACVRGEPRPSAIPGDETAG